MLKPTDAADLASAIAELAAPLVPGELALRQLLSAMREQQVSKGQHLARAGDVAEALFFVRYGILRYYYLADGVEHTGQFFTAGMAVADVASLTSGGLAEQNIDALTDSAVLVVPRTALLAAYDADHAIERFGRRSIEMAMAGAQRRSAALLISTPEQRYRHFVRARPDVATVVPQYVIASYLGITPESLSRIRARS